MVASVAEGEALPGRTFQRTTLFQVLTFVMVREYDSQDGD